MRKILKGRRYDTDKATEVAVYSNGLGPRDFRSVDERLYRTPRGRWFVVGEGGPMTRWATSHGDGSRSGGEGLQPLTDDEARDWLEYHGETDAIEEHFGDAIEDA